MFPWVAAARPGDPGHPLSVPSIQGAGRLDNPKHYRVLYASGAPSGAVAETFGNRAVWTEDLFAGRPDLPGSRAALATCELEGTVLDLDDARQLVERDLRPSEVVSRNRHATQAWALRVFREAGWAGIRWWSAWDPSWSSVGLWDLTRLSLVDVTPLARDHLSVREAMAVLLRPWVEIRTP